MPKLEYAHARTNATPLKFHRHSYKFIQSTSLEIQFPPYRANSFQPDLVRWLLLHDRFPSCHLLANENTPPSCQILFTGGPFR